MPRVLTGHRQRVLDHLRSVGDPQNALDLYRALGDRMNLATVYRALPVLEAEGLIEGLTVDCPHEGPTRYYLAAGQGHRHFFHCTACHRFFPLGPCDLTSWIPGFEAASGHRVDGHALSLTGVCRDCRT